MVLNRTAVSCMSSDVMEIFLMDVRSPECVCVCVCVCVCTCTSGHVIKHACVCGGEGERRGRTHSVLRLLSHMACRGIYLCLNTLLDHQSNTEANVFLVQYLFLGLMGHTLTVRDATPELELPVLCSVIVDTLNARQKAFVRAVVGHRQI